MKCMRRSKAGSGNKSTFPAGERIVEVQAQSGPNNTLETYEIKLTGQLTYTHYFELYPDHEFEHLTGGPAKLTIEQTSEGRSDGVIVLTADQPRRRGHHRADHARRRAAGRA